MSAFRRLFPAEVDNRFDGQRAALFLLGLLIFLKLAMSLNSIFNTAQVAQGADGIPLDSYGPDAAREVLLLFALMAVGQLFLTLVALAVLIRWRTLVPFIFLVLLAEHLVRRAVGQMYAAGSGITTSTALIVNLVLLGLIVLGLALSLIPGRQRGPAPPSKEEHR